MTNHTILIIRNSNIAIMERVNQIIFLFFINSISYNALGGPLECCSPWLRHGEGKLAHGHLHMT